MLRECVSGIVSGFRMFIVFYVVLVVKEMVVVRRKVSVGIYLVLIWFCVMLMRYLVVFRDL